MAKKRDLRTDVQRQIDQAKHAANKGREDQLKQLLRLQLQERGLPEPPEEEYAIVPGRRFRADLAYPLANPPICIEIQGGRWVANTGHNSPSGLDRDYEKSNLAQINGWVYLQVTPEQIEDGAAVEWIAQALKEAA